MRVDPSDLFVPRDIVRTYLEQDWIRKYADAGVLVAAAIRHKPKAAEMLFHDLNTKDDAVYLSIDSLETLASSKRPHWAHKKNAGMILRSRADTAISLKHLLDDYQGNEVIFYTPPGRIAALDDKPLLREMDDKERRAYRENIRLSRWYTASSFLESLVVDDKKIRRSEQGHFVRYMWDGLGIHPFLTPDGIWCYTLRDMIAIRKELGLPGERESEMKYDDKTHTLVRDENYDRVEDLPILRSIDPDGSGYGFGS